MAFWSVNPYIGCEFGCSYCYARDTHRYAVERATRSGARPRSLPLLPAAESFERHILVKRNAAALLERELRTHALDGASLVIGSATDPYQPAERVHGITRALLEVLAAHVGLAVEIITKSPLIVRDVALLERLSERNTLRVHLSIASVHRRIVRRLEARSPAPAARIRALAALRAAGIDAGVLIAPIIPGITDSWHDLALLFEAARRAGATHVVGSALRLGPAARRNFLPQLAREFPALVQRYAHAYAGQEQAPHVYQRALAERLDHLCTRFGFPPEARHLRPGAAQKAFTGPRHPMESQLHLI
jgi:DNA repair photolyase